MYVWLFRNYRPSHRMMETCTIVSENTPVVWFYGASRTGILQCSSFSTETSTSSERCGVGSCGKVQLQVRRVEITLDSNASHQDFILNRRRLQCERLRIFNILSKKRITSKVLFMQFHGESRTPQHQETNIGPQQNKLPSLFCAALLPHVCGWT